MSRLPLSLRVQFGTFPRGQFGTSGARKSLTWFSPAESSGFDFVDCVVLSTASHAMNKDKLTGTSADSAFRRFRALAFGSQRAAQQNTQQKNENASESPSHGHIRRVGGKIETAKFQMKNKCLLALHRGDITKWNVDGQTDAIVNAANVYMLGGGGVDGAIHRAAGPDLYKACLNLPLVGHNIRCRTGDAVITPGFRLPVSKVIHTAGPQYRSDEESGPLLENCYKNTVHLAEKSGIKYLAFPAISCGIYGYPYDKAAEIALDAVGKYSDGLKEVHFVLFEEGSWFEWLETASKVFERLQEE